MRLIRSAALGLIAALAAWPSAAATGNPVPAVWQEHHVSFVYMGRTSRYSCDGLSDKVRAMLMDLGARRDLRITAIGCEEYGRPPEMNSLSPSLDIHFSSPAVPDTSAKPRHAGASTPVDARYEPFKITTDAFRNMGRGDCELVEEFARQVLPKLATRDLKQNITCIPYQLSGSHYFVGGQILRALPSTERSIRQ